MLYGHGRRVPPPPLLVGILASSSLREAPAPGLLAFARLFELAPTPTGRFKCYAVFSSLLMPVPPGRVMGFAAACPLTPRSHNITAT